MYIIYICKCVRDTLGARVSFQRWNSVETSSPRFPSPRQQSVQMSQSRQKSVVETLTSTKIWSKKGENRVLIKQANQGEKPET